ncbi:unnamed protein product [Amaranthus hypochondriacus]
MTKHNADNPPTSSCFTAFFKRFICTTNPIPTHPIPTTHHILPQKPIKIDPFTHHSSTISDTNNNNPGIIARLMGLDSLPNNQKNTTLDSLFRSKSLNSIHFIPDFDPTRNTFHRRARTSASFHEQGHNFLVKIDENLEVSDDHMMLEETMVCDHENNKSNREKNSCRRKDNGYRNGSKKKYEECYTSNYGKCSRRSNYRRSRYSNISNSEEKNAIKKRKLVKKGKFIGTRKEVQSDNLLQSSSPVSVLDLQKEFIPFSKGKEKDITKNSAKRRSSPKMKSYENLPQLITPKTQQNYEVTNYFVEMLGQVCKLSEEKACEPKWVSKCESMKLHFVEDLSKDLGQYMFNFLLDELLYEILISCN